MVYQNRANQRTPAPAPDVTKAQATMAQKHRRFKVLFGPNNTRRRDRRARAAAPPCARADQGRVVGVRFRGGSVVHAHAHIMPGRRKGSASVPAIYPDSRRRGAGPAIRIFVQRSFRARRGRGRSQSKHYCCLCVVFTSQGKQTCTACPCLACPCLNGQKVFTLVQPLIRQACRVQTRRDLLCSIL